MRHRVVRTLRRALVLLALASAATPVAAGRVVAIGDVHGDLPALRGILQEAALTDAAGRWSGGDATLVITGDFLDRGPAFRGVMDYLQDLQADAAGKGQVDILLGNHEVMNLLGDLRYVTPENFAEFAADEKPGKQDAEWRDYVRWRKAQVERLGLPAPSLGEAEERAWREAHPPGWFGQRDLLAPEGEYGRWLRSLPAVLRIGDTVFVHGGISPGLAGQTPEEIRDRVAEELALWDRYRHDLVAEQVIPPYATLQETFDAAKQEKEALEGTDKADASRLQLLDAVIGSGDWYIEHPDGPLWFRGYARWSDEEGPGELAPILATPGIGRLVVGHSPTEDRRIHRRFDGKVYLIDTGMLASHYDGGRASALEILEDGQITAIYRDGRTVLQPARVPPAPAPDDDPGATATAVGRYLGADGKPLPFRTDDEVLAFLATADVVEQKRIKSGVNQPFKLTLEKDGVRAHAVFRDVNVESDVAHLGGHREMFFRDSYLFEPAAYELARMLGMENVPPVVLRRLGTSPGSVQLWVEQAMTEEKRVADAILPPDAETWNRQMEAVRMFDALILNTDRNAGNLLIDGSWTVWMIDHTRAFRRDKKLPDSPRFARIERGLYERLQRLDPDETRERLKPFLRKYEIEAVLARRDALLDYIRSLIAANGEAEVLYESGARP